MQLLCVKDVDNAVSSMEALQQVLYSSLEDVEKKILVAEAMNRRLTRDERAELEGMKLARANLLSGIQSIQEVLQWVNALAAKDAEGDAPQSTRHLPYLQIKELN